MTTGTLTLADFLLARFAEDEQAALAHSLWTDSGSPIPYDQQVRRVLRAAERAEGTVKVHYLGQSWLAGGPGSVDRVLAECEANRRIVTAYTAPAAWPLELRYLDDDIMTALEWVMKQLALPYADHPDYREEWRP